MRQVDTIVVGAGAAGLSAARILQRGGLTVRILEAKNRVGGRAFTDHESLAVPFDHGCTWLSAGPYNPLLKLAKEDGFRMEACFFPTANTKTFREDRWATEAEEIERTEFIAQCELALQDAARSGLDVAWTDLIDTKSAWMPYFNGWNDRNQGATTSACSTLDVARSQGDGENLFVFDGYGSLIEKLGEGLLTELELEAEVDRIEWSGDGVAIRSSKGEFSSRSAIVTVSTGVLASNQIEFKPALPAAWRAAIESLPMGKFVKVAIQFDRDIYDVFRDDIFIYLEKPSTFIDIVTGMDDHRMAVAYICGALAEEIEQMSDQDARDFILDRLEKVFGSGIREHVVGSLCTRWGTDPHVRGSYASALPGRSDARAELASTLGGRIIFAGEATSQAHYGFAHGAYLEGKAAAERVIAMLNEQAR